MITIFGKEVPTTLDELVNPLWAALLIIDMQNDCCSVGGSAHQAGADISMYREVIPKIKSFARKCRAVGVRVFNVRMLTLPDGGSDSSAWLRLRMRVHKNYDSNNEGAWMFTVKDTWGAEFVADLAPEPGDFVITKFRSSAFHETNLDLLLRSNGIRSTIVCGCTTEGCVESTVRDATFYDYYPVVLADCVGSDVPELHEASMRVMSAYRADMASSDQIVNIWDQIFLSKQKEA